MSVGSGRTATLLVPHSNGSCVPACIRERRPGRTPESPSPRRSDQKGRTGGRAKTPSSFYYKARETSKQRIGGNHNRNYRMYCIELAIVRPIQSPHLGHWWGDSSSAESLKMPPHQPQRRNREAEQLYPKGSKQRLSCSPPLMSRANSTK